MTVREMTDAIRLGGSGGGSSVTVESLTVTANDTYTPESGKAYGPVVVSVPNTYTAADEGKTVQRAVERTISFFPPDFTGAYFNDGDVMNNDSYQYVSPVVLTTTEMSNASLYCIDSEVAVRVAAVSSVTEKTASFSTFEDDMYGPRFYKCADASGSPLFAVVPVTDENDFGETPAGIYICSLSADSADKPWAHSMSSDNAVQILGNEYVLA